MSKNTCKQQLPIVYMSFNNVEHLITNTITTLQHFATLYHTSPNYTSLHLSTLHFLSFALRFAFTVRLYRMHTLSRFIPIYGSFVLVSLLDS